MGATQVTRRTVASSVCSARVRYTTRYKMGYASACVGSSGAGRSGAGNAWLGPQPFGSSRKMVSAYGQQELCDGQGTRRQVLPYPFVARLRHQVTRGQSPWLLHSAEARCATRAWTGQRVPPQRTALRTVVVWARSFRSNTEQVTTQRTSIWVI